MAAGLRRRARLRAEPATRGAAQTAAAGRQLRHHRSRSSHVPVGPVAQPAWWRATAGCHAATGRGSDAGTPGLRGTGPVALLDRAGIPVERGAARHRALPVRAGAGQDPAPRPLNQMENGEMGTLTYFSENR